MVGMAWKDVVFIALLLDSALSSYLQTFEAELLAPAVGQQDFLWFSFLTSGTTQFAASKYVSFQLKEKNIEKRLSFSDCSSVVEAPGWPNFVHCQGGFFQLDDTLKANTRYEAVLRVKVLPGSQKVLLEIALAYQVITPATLPAQYVFFETNQAVSPPELNTYAIGEHLPNPQSPLRNDRLVIPFPQTFVPNNVTVPMHFALYSSDNLNGQAFAGPKNDDFQSITDVYLGPPFEGPYREVLIFARPFTMWSLQPDGIVPTTISGNESSASCLNSLDQFYGLVPIECYWIAFGTASPGVRKRANGFKLIFRGTFQLDPLTFILNVTSPAVGTFEPWIVVSVDYEVYKESKWSLKRKNAVPARGTITAQRGFPVYPTPAVEQLSYSSRVTFGANVMKIKVNPGVAIHGSSVADQQGHIRVFMPPQTGSIILCSLTPSDIWNRVSASFKQYRVDQDNDKKTCTFNAIDPKLHFFDRTEYIFEISFFNYGLMTRGEDNIWTVEIKNSGPFVAPAGTAHNVSFVQTFDVVDEFPVFRVSFSFLSVSIATATGTKNAINIDFKMSGAEVRRSRYGEVACLRLEVPDDFSFGSDCDKFQPLLNLPADTLCSTENARTLRIVLPKGLSFMTATFYSFAVQMWNPSAAKVLQGADEQPWILEAKYGRDCMGPPHNARVGYTTVVRDGAFTTSPLTGAFDFIGSDSLAVGITTTLTIHFSLAAPIREGQFLLFSAPRDFRWASFDRNRLLTDADSTDAPASWQLWNGNVPRPVSSGDEPNEIILAVGGGERGLLPLTRYGLRTQIIHPSTGDSVSVNPYWETGVAEARRWYMEAFSTETGDVPQVGYRSSPGEKLPFRNRLVGAAAIGYDLQGLVSCRVVPWQNLPRQVSQILFEFTPTVGVDLPSPQSLPNVLRIVPPRTFVFIRVCEAKAPLPSSAGGAALERETLPVSICKHETWDEYIWLVLTGPLVADNPYFIQVHDLEMPTDTPFVNAWRLEIVLNFDGDTASSYTGQETENAVRCIDVPGFPVALPIPMARLVDSGVSAWPYARQTVTFAFGVPEPTLSDFHIHLSGPVGFQFSADCTPDLSRALNPLASARLPGRILWCIGAGGGANRAVAKLYVDGAAEGGMIVGEMYGLSIIVTNGPYIEAMPAYSNDWRIQVSDPTWYFQDAVAAKLPSYTVFPPVTLDFLISTAVSSDPFKENKVYSNLTTRFVLPEGILAGATLKLAGPLDGFAFTAPCTLQHTDQLDWTPAEDPIPEGATSKKRGSLLSSLVFTNECRPSCVSLYGALEGCKVQNYSMEARVRIPLQAQTPYCFASRMRNPEGDGAGLWKIEFFKKAGPQIFASPPTQGPVTGALPLPDPSQAAAFTILPSSRSKASVNVDLTVIFSVPAGFHGAVTLIAPVIGGALSGRDEVEVGTVVPPVLAPNSGAGSVGVPFFDFRNTCNHMKDIENALPKPLSCAASSHAVSLITGSAVVDDEWEPFRRYNILLTDVPTGLSTGAIALFGGNALPPFSLMVISSAGSVIASGRTNGWAWIPEMRVTMLELDSPLDNTDSSLELHVQSSSALFGRPARLEVLPPPWFAFVRSDAVPSSWDKLPGAGHGPLCSLKKEKPLAHELCYPVECKVTAIQEDGTEIDLPQCALSPTSKGCCYGQATAGSPVFVQLLTAPDSNPIPPDTFLQISFSQVRASTSLADPLPDTSNLLADPRNLWNITTSGLPYSKCWTTRLANAGFASFLTTTTSTAMNNTVSTDSGDAVSRRVSASTNNANIDAGASTGMNIVSSPSGRRLQDDGSISTGNSSTEVCDDSTHNLTLGTTYVIVDEVNRKSMDLFAYFIQAIVDPGFTTLSYEDNPVTFLFELSSTLNRFHTVLRITSPPGFIFRSIIYDVADEVRIRYPNREILSLPPGFSHATSGPILTIKLFPKILGSLVGNEMYGFAVPVNNPHVRPRAVNNFWVLETIQDDPRTFNSTAAEAGQGRRVHWARVEGFVLQGAVQQFEIMVSSRLPLYPMNILTLIFMLSLPLPRSNDLGKAIAWSIYDRASQLVIIPPEGFIFRSDCRAPVGMVSIATADIESSASVELVDLPPPWRCEGSQVGSYSNATLRFIPQEDSIYSGVLIQDQQYGVHLVVDNPLQTIDNVNQWRLVSLWGANKEKFLVLHDHSIDGFSIEQMPAVIQPTNVAPGIFHVSNITFIPTEESDENLGSLCVVAPRGIELSCSGFLPGTLITDLHRERLACVESDSQLARTDATEPGIGYTVPAGLWRLCLRFLHLPKWNELVQRGSVIMNELTGARTGLWFSVSVTNSMYLATDNVWVVLALSEHNRLIDVGRMNGYGLTNTINTIAT